MARGAAAAEKTNSNATHEWRGNGVCFPGAFGVRGAVRGPRMAFFNDIRPAKISVRSAN